MSPIRIIILLVAAGAAIMAAMLVSNMSNDPAPVQIVEAVEDDEPQIELVQILIADGDLPLGHRIAESDLKWAPWPEEQIDPRYFKSTDGESLISELAGSIVHMPIFSGEPIIDPKIIRNDETSIMAAVLNEGMRAVAVEISVETAAGGFILPNDRVDVILSYAEDINSVNQVREKVISKTILQNVRVLAIDQSYRTEGEEDVVLGTTATLELSPRHAEMLILGQRMGDLSLILRGVQDTASSGMKVIASSDFSSSSEISGTIRTYQGGNARTATIGAE